jgi:hypothetical protein
MTPIALHPCEAITCSISTTDPTAARKHLSDRFDRLRSPSGMARARQLRYHLQSLRRCRSCNQQRYSTGRFHRLSWLIVPDLCPQHGHSTGAGCPDRSSRSSPAASSQSPAYRDHHRSSLPATLSAGTTDPFLKLPFPNQRFVSASSFHGTSAPLIWLCTPFGSIRFLYSQ